MIAEFSSAYAVILEVGISKARVWEGVGLASSPKSIVSKVAACALIPLIPGPLAALGARFLFGRRERRAFGSDSS